MRVHAEFDSKGRLSLREAGTQEWVAGFSKQGKGWVLRTAHRPEVEAALSGKVFANGTEAAAALSGVEKVGEFR